MTNAVLADYKQGLETIKLLCEKAAAGAQAS